MYVEAIHRSNCHVSLESYSMSLKVRRAYKSADVQVYITCTRGNVNTAN